MELQGTVNVEVLKEGCASIKKEVLTGLSLKAKFIESQWQKELTENSVKRINIEQEHIKNVAGLIKSHEALTEQLELELQDSRQRERLSYMKAEIALKETNDYMDRYYDAVIRLNKLNGPTR